MFISYRTSVSACYSTVLHTAATVLHTAATVLHTAATVLHTAATQRKTMSLTATYCTNCNILHHTI